MTDEARDAKRRADVQITKDDPDSGGEDEPFTTGIQKASEDVLEKRRKLTVKRHPGAAGTAPKASNPFAGITLSAPATSNPASTTDKTTQPLAAPVVSSGFGGLAASSAGGFGGFGGLATTNGGASGFGGLAFGSSGPLAFGTSITTTGPAATATTSGAGGILDNSLKEDKECKEPEEDKDEKEDKEKGGAVSIFGAQQTSVKEKEPSVAQQTGEEGEETKLSCSASLFEFVEEDGKREWRTRGSGELKLNVDRETGKKGRLIMRQKGVGRLLLNASVFKNMGVSVMADGNGISFSCINCVEKNDDKNDKEDANKMSTFAVKVRDAKDQVEALTAAIREFV